jgi:uncharacterized Ntn-hydrolase superfamily protein
MTRPLLALLLLAACAAHPAPAPPQAASDPPVATFSIVAFDPDQQEWGVAVQSRFLGVGAVVPWAKAGVGAVATQAFANTRYGPGGLELLGQGKSAQEAVDALTAADERKARRQVGIVDKDGNAATFTGEGCTAWAGGRKGKHYCVQGNILAGEAVVDAMAKAFEEGKGDLGDRMIAALQAGQGAGGDKRGMQSAALLIVKEGGGYGGNDRYRDVRVDDHDKPIDELQRIYALHKETFRPRRGGQGR